jgi:hypothetical protein
MRTYPEARPLTGLPTLLIVASLLIITAAGTQMPGWAQVILALGIGFIGLPSALFLPMLMFWLIRDTPERRAEFFRSRQRKHTIHAFALMCAVTLVLAFFRNSVS